MAFRIPHLPMGPQLPKGPHYGMLAEFATPADLYHACERVRDAGFTRWDAHTPFPVHGLEGAMGLRRSPLPWIVLVMGLTGAALGFGLQWWVHASAYPLVISGKPYFSWPAFIPITFELGVLFASLGAVLGMLGLNRLPMHHHPLFQSKVFERVTDDAFFISIESWDPRFDQSGTRKLLESLGARSVELLESWMERDRVALRPEQATIPAGHPWNRIPVISAVCALLGAVACAILGAANPKQFFFSWLVSYLFFLSLSLGALFFVLIQYASQGGWGVVLRRIGETVFAMLPVMAVLFLPVLIGLHDLYSWTVPGAAEHDALLRWKAPYLNVPFFLIRAALYFGIWSVIALLYYRGSRGQDVTGDPAVSARLRRLAGPAIIVLALTQTFASVDWIMSLSPHWYSTIFGVYFFTGSFVGFIALLSVVVVAMRREGLLDTVISVEHLHDIGKLLFAFTAFWAYIAFSQFFLIWYANLPEETIWYRARLEGSWTMISLLLMAGHFGVPFFYLMGRAVKRRGSTLALGGAWVLAMHYVDIYWQVMPTLHAGGVHPSVLDVAALVTVGGCFVAAASWLLRRQALVPLRDPRLAESLAFENV